MRFNGTNTEDLGLVPISVKGGYDMPGRLSPFFHNWGDEIEPIFNNGFGERTIQAKFLFDTRRQSVAQTLDALTRTYINATTITLDMTGFNGAVGSHQVKVAQISDHKVYKSNDTLVMNFHEQVPAFPGTLPGTQDGGTQSIDGYSFSQFGAIIARTRNISGLGQTNESPVTVYKQSRGKGQYRALHEFYLDCYIVGSSMQDSLTKLHDFQKVLSQEKVLPFVYNSFNFNVLFSSRFSVNRIGTRAFKFTVPLNRLP